MISLLLSLTLLTATTAERWPAFLGPPMESLQSSDLPLRWSPSEGVAWTAEIVGHGQSSPVLWGKQIFVTSTDGPMKDRYHLTCYDLESGAKRWTHELKNSVPVANSYYVSRAAPTPVVDADGVVAFFESGDCVALTLDGEERWSRNLAADEGPFEAEFGLGASPCQSDSSVFILLEHDGPSCLLALDKKTGETRWRTDRESTRSWSSPAMVQIAGSPHVVVSSGGTADGYDPESGKKLWTLDDLGGNTGCTPIDCGDGRFLVGASPGRNGENAGSATRSNCLVRVERAGDRFEAQKQWIAEGAFPTWASPILHAGLAYWVNRAGVVFCFDGETGEEVYSSRTEQSCWATPFAVGDRVYLFGKDGMVTVLRSGRQFDVLAENESWNPDELPAEAPLAEESDPQRRRASAMFSKPTLYGYAVASDAIVIRIGNALLCMRDDANGASR